MASASVPIRETSGPGAALGVAGLALLGAALGVGLVLGELQALWIALAVIGCLAVLYDFRVGAVLLILLLPISESTLFPHELFGLTGLNPLNLLIGATLVSFLLHGRRSGGATAAGPFMSRPLIWLYLAPIVIAGILGSRHAQDIAPVLYELEEIHFLDAGGYLRDVLAKPLLIVLIGLLVGAAVARSKKPEGFLVPIGVSIWLMCMVAVGYVVKSGASIAELAGSESREFFAGIGLHANDLGRLYAVAYAFFLFAWAESRSRSFKLLCVASMAVVTTALVLTFSRGAFVGFMVVNGLFLLWRVNAKTAAITIGTT